MYMYYYTISAISNTPLTDSLVPIPKFLDVESFTRFDLDDVLTQALQQLFQLYSNYRELQTS